eukprot:tig00000601_g2290.t1
MPAFHEELGAQVASSSRASAVQRIRGPSGEYELGWPLGLGGFSEVFDGVETRTGARVAVKRVNLAHLDARDELNLRREVDNMRRLRHDCVVRLLDDFREADDYYIVMEHVDGMELYEKCCSPRLCLTLALGGAEGGYKSDFAGCLRHAVAAALRVSPQRVDVPIALGAARDRVQVQVYPPNDLTADPGAGGACNVDDRVKYLEALRAAARAELASNPALEGARLVADEIDQTYRLEEEAARQSFAQVVQAVRYMHEQGVVHRDLKLDNVMTDPEARGSVKLIDFGFSRSVESALASHVGTRPYMAPEVMSVPLTGYDGRAIDVWSLGVILFLMLAGGYPFDSAGHSIVYPEDMREIFAGAGAAVPAGARDLLLAIFQRDPALRITVPGILAHPWLQPALRHGSPAGPSAGPSAEPSS